MWAWHAVQQFLPLSVCLFFFLPSLPDCIKSNVIRTWPATGEQKETRAGHRTKQSRQVLDISSWHSDSFYFLTLSVGVGPAAAGAVGFLVRSLLVLWLGLGLGLEVGLGLALAFGLLLVQLPLLLLKCCCFPTDVSLSYTI